MYIKRHAIIKGRLQLVESLFQRDSITFFESSSLWYPQYRSNLQKCIQPALPSHLCYPSRSQSQPRPYPTTICGPARPVCLMSPNATSPTYNFNCYRRATVRNTLTKSAKLSPTALIQTPTLPPISRSPCKLQDGPQGGTRIPRFSSSFH